ncbi:fibrobacter succinogenes major paralogous domain-containing protein [Pedobacter psychrotolerans]|uniref:fibrobacter succinogenes major paralogous domain-containing protein n=1 Tax=Pedobacter psychrotolerans TaxID=1843235 RepID=UPI003F998ACA
MKKCSYTPIFFLLISLFGCQKENNPVQSPELSDFILGGVRVGEPAFLLTHPKSKSSGTFSFKTSDTSMITIQENLVTIRKNGTCVITAIQQEAEGFRKDSIKATLVISPRLAPMLTGFVIPDKKVTDPPFILTSLKSNSNGEITFRSNNAAVAVVTGSLITIKGAGKAIITAYQAQSGIYSAYSISADLFVTDAVIAETLTDVDGNVYKTVKLGNQTWMMENLRTAHYRDKTPIQNVIGNSDWSTQSSGAYCTYNNNPELGKTYGFLYNWYAVNNNHQLAPQGWHIPTNAEWNVLYDYIGGDRYSGSKIQESGVSHWIDDTGASNSTKFTGLPGGKRNGNGTYENLSYNAYWWTTTTNSTGTAQYYNLYVKGYIEVAESFKNLGYSIRCIKD